MKYVLIIDAQTSNVTGPGAAPLARDVARRINAFALSLRESKDVITTATLLATEAEPEPSLHGCLTGVVRYRTCRHVRPPRMYSLLRQIHEHGSNPERIAVCGFHTAGNVLRCALALHEGYPNAEVAILEDLCCDAPEAHEAALVVARANGVAVATANPVVTIDGSQSAK